MLSKAWNEDIVDRWNYLKNEIILIQKYIIGIKTSGKKNRWMTDDTLLLMEERSRRDEWLEIEHLEEKHDHFNVHKLVKETTGRIKQPHLMRISDDHNTVITNPNEILDHLKNYIEQLFKGQKSEITVHQYKSEKSPKILWSEIIQVIKQQNWQSTRTRRRLYRSYKTSRTNRTYNLH